MAYNYQQQHQQPQSPYRQQQQYAGNSPGLNPPHSPGGYFSPSPTHSNAYPQSPGQQYGSAYRDDSYAASRDNLYPSTPPARPYSPAMSMYAAAAAAEATRSTSDPFRDAPGMNEPTPELAADSMHTGMDGRKRWSTYPPTSDRYDPTKSNKKQYIITAIIVGILVLAGVAAGIVITKLHKKNSSNGGSNSLSVNGDPSNFVKDSRLKNSFWGMAYSPIGSQYQYGCSANLSSVIQDVQILSQLTTRVRLYGSDCNVTALVLQAVQDTKVNLTIYPAIFLNQVNEDPQELAWTRQVNNITYAFQNYGIKNVGGVGVGNEFLLNKGKLSDLADFVTRFKAILSKNSWDLMVGTADAASQYTSAVAEATDFFMANDHAYFAKVTVQQAPGWTWDFFEENDVSIAKKASNKPDVYIGETGWPSNSSDVKGLTNGGAVVNMPNFQYYIDNFVCAANANGTQYFWFELFDEQWKDVEFGGIEAHWGVSGPKPEMFLTLLSLTAVDSFTIQLFDQYKKLKQITLPDCTHD